VRVVINGKVRRISKLHAAIMQLANKAFSGDTRSILEMLKSYQQNAREMSRQALNPQLQALVDALNAGPVEK